MSDEPSKRDEGHDPIFGDTQEYFEKHIKPLVAGIGKAKTITLYEGLPHQHWERELLARELKDKKTIKVRGFPFYAGMITPGEVVTKELAAVGGCLKTYGRYRGPKSCGGYHPDWCIVFKDGDDLYQVHVCFGCHEACIYGPKNSVKSDLDEGALKKLVALFAPLRKNRPKEEIKK